MAAMFAWPSELKIDSVGLALTFILPAYECNLSCSFCAIKQRREVDGASLSVADYVYFLKDVVKHHPTAIVAIQGYEPLLPDTWPYTVALLTAGRSLRVPTTLVTNGVLLPERFEGLAALAPSGVTVSIDSSVAAEHDKLRGRPGAFDAAVAGLKLLAAVPGFSNKITVSSVLFPRRRHLLEGMPRLLNTLGIKHWVVAPVFHMAKPDIGGPIASAPSIVQDLLALRGHAADFDISLVLDDELKTLPSSAFDYTDLVVRRFERPDGLIRLVPSGACSAGRDILRPVSADTPVWHPAMKPHEFVESIVPLTVDAGAVQQAA